MSASGPGRITTLHTAREPHAVDDRLGSPARGSGSPGGSVGRRQRSAGRGSPYAAVQRDDVLGRRRGRSRDHLAHRRILALDLRALRSRSAPGRAAAAPPRSRSSRTDRRGSRARSAGGRGARSPRRARRRRLGVASTGKVLTLVARALERGDETAARRRASSGCVEISERASAPARSSPLGDDSYVFSTLSSDLVPTDPSPRISEPQTDDDGARRRAPTAPPSRPSCTRALRPSPPAATRAPRLVALAARGEEPERRRQHRVGVGGSATHSSSRWSNVSQGTPPRTRAGTRSRTAWASRSWWRPGCTGTARSPPTAASRRALELPPSASVDPGSISSLSTDASSVARPRASFSR